VYTPSSPLEPMLALTATVALAEPPYHAVVADTAHIYWLDEHTHQISSYDSGGSHVVATLPARRKKRTTNLVLGPDGVLYASLGSKIWKISTDGKVQAAPPPAGWELAFNKDYASDPRADGVWAVVEGWHKWSLVLSDGTAIKTGEVGEWEDLYGIAIGPTGGVYGISDIAVYYWNREGNLVHIPPPHDVGSHLLGIDVGPDGGLWVLEDLWGHPCLSRDDHAGGWTPMDGKCTSVASAPPP
jgi:hypothetical protein